MVISFVFAVILAIVAGLWYYYDSSCDKGMPQLIAITSLVFFVIAIFLLCSAPFCVVPLLVMIAITSILFVC